MIDHFGINCSDWERSQEFYDTVLAVLGYSRRMDHGVAIGYGHGQPMFWIADASAGDASGPNREVHFAFLRRLRPRSGRQHCRGGLPRRCGVTSGHGRS